MNKKEYHEYYTRRKQKTGTLDGFNIDNWEEVPDEDLYEDGELYDTDVKNKIMKMMYLGKYKLIREIK